jgi:D-alanyl-D-alanine dipeptidase
MRWRRYVLTTLLVTGLGSNLACGRGDTRPANTPRPTAAPAQVEPWPREADDVGDQKPQPSPPGFSGLVGEYGAENEPVYVLEREGSLWFVIGRGQACRLAADRSDPRRFVADRTCGSTTAVFTRNVDDTVATVALGGRVYPYRHVGPSDGSGQLRVEPVRPVAVILEESKAASPPVEAGTFRDAELVELTMLDPTFKLDIRYATTNNFLGAVFYAEPRAFLQRPAAEALVRVQRALHPQGYGLMIHDGYRPWFVTKTFWEATPENKKWLVADPSRGSRHNRGAAVDLTLYDLAAGRGVEMPSTYDESTHRAYAFYPGGTHLQRWHRALLRRSMETEGFIVNPEEWWHFDYKDAGSYRIGNVAFDVIK